MIMEMNLTHHFEHVPTVPHDQIVGLQSEADALLLVIPAVPNAKGILTGKIFEYLAIGNPVLCIGPPDGDAAAILQEAEAGMVVDFDDKEGFKKSVMELYQNWKSGSRRKTSPGISRFSRKELCGRVATILDEIAKRNS